MLSIVIPVYNVEKYLSQCLASVLNLKIQFEIVLINDGSTDNSGALCDFYAQIDSRVKVIHQKNGGLSAARNTGILNSKGKYIMFLDSDDFLDPVETNVMLKCLIKEPQVLIGLYSNYFSNSSRSVRENAEVVAKVNGYTNIHTFLEAIPSDGSSFYMTAWRFVVKRSFLLENGLFFTPQIYHEDEEWTMRLLCCADNVFLTKNYFYEYRREREGSITSTVKIKHILDTFIIIEKAHELISLQEHFSYKEKYLKCRIANLYLNAMIHFYSFEKNERKQVYTLLCHYHKDINNISGRIGRIVKVSDRIVGLRLTCFLLHCLRNVKKLINRVVYGSRKK